MKIIKSSAIYLFLGYIVHIKSLKLGLKKKTNIFKRNFKETSSHNNHINIRTNIETNPDKQPCIFDSHSTPKKAEVNVSIAINNKRAEHNIKGKTFNKINIDYSNNIKNKHEKSFHSQSDIKDSEQMDDLTVQKNPANSTNAEIMEEPGVNQEGSIQKRSSDETKTENDSKATKIQHASKEIQTNPISSSASNQDSSIYGNLKKEKTNNLINEMTSNAKLNYYDNKPQESEQRSSNNLDSGLSHSMKPETQAIKPEEFHPEPKNPDVENNIKFGAKYIPYSTFQFNAPNNNLHTVPIDDSIKTSEDLNLTMIQNTALGKNGSNRGRFKFDSLVNTGNIFIEIHPSFCDIYIFSFIRTSDAFGVSFNNAAIQII